MIRMLSDETIFAMAPMSTGYRVSTNLFLVAWVAGTIACLIFAPWYSAIMVLGIGTLVHFIVLGFYRPVAIIITDDALVIRWMMRKRRIGLSDIEAVEPGQTHRPWGMKVVGCNGVYGSFGFYKLWRGETRDLYLTNVDCAVVLRLKDHRPLIISPDEPEPFMQTIQQRIPPRDA
jgi:hypothetical protein